MPEVTDPNDREPHPLGVNRPDTERPKPPAAADTLAALDRLLNLVELANGDAMYEGAHNDATIVRRAYYAAVNFHDGPLA